LAAVWPSYGSDVEHPLTSWAKMVGFALPERFVVLKQYTILLRQDYVANVAFVILSVQGLPPKSGVTLLTVVELLSMRM
jgi:hypothetical protein